MIHTENEFSVTTAELMEDSAVIYFFEASDGMAESTQKNYLKALKRYCAHVKMMPADFIAEAKQEQKSIQAIEDRSIIRKLALFPSTMKDLAPKTKQNMVICINVFYKQNYVILPPPIKRKKNRVMPLEDNFFIPNKEQVQTALKLSSLRNKTIIMLQATSCLGLSEIINLKIKNLSTDDEGITIIRCIRQKTDYRFRTFCTPETTEMIRLYLDSRNMNDETKVLGEDDLVFIAEEEKGNRNITEASLMTAYRNLGKRMGMETPKGTFAKIRTHNFRKYGNQRLIDAGAPQNFVDYISGRRESATHEAYHQWSDERLKELYSSFMSSLSLLTEIQIITNQELYSALGEQKAALDEVYRELQEMKAREDVINKKAAAIALAESINNMEKTGPLSDGHKKLKRDALGTLGKT